MDETARVVVGVDGSEQGRKALRWALGEAELRGARLVVLHAWREPKVFVPAEYPAALVEMGQMEEAALHLIDGELDAVGADASSAVEIERSAVEGSTAQSLINASRAADLVVVGRRGRAG